MRREVAILEERSCMMRSLKRSRSRGSGTSAGLEPQSSRANWIHAASLAQERLLSRRPPALLLPRASSSTASHLLGYSNG